MKALYSFVLGAAVCSCLTAVNPAFAQGTAFTYQGRLNSGTNPANGSFDLAFALFNASTSGTQVGSTFTSTATAVSNGLFTTTIDFGAGVFNVTNLWLGISVRSNGTGSYVALSPLQQITPAPYAVYAESANAMNLVGTFPASQLSSIGNGTGNGSSLSNFFIGPAGNAATTGYGNTASGYNALVSNTTGNENTASGYNALVSNTTGSYNTANGRSALTVNTTGFYNTASGYKALAANTTGSANTANGYNALLLSTTGDDNTADGASALFSNTTGDDNTADGAAALFYNTTGTNNAASGHDALFNNTTGSCNAASGDEALFANSTGSYNTATGCYALADTVASYNIALGYQAGQNIFIGSSNIDIGNSGLADDINIIRIGAGQTAAYIAGAINGNGGGLSNLNASQLSSIGNGNFFIGSAGNAATTGSQNTANGFQALTANTTGYGNTANGCQALDSSSTGVYNTANGVFALDFNTIGDQNTATGGYALRSNVVGSANTATGFFALANASGSQNSAFGFNALAFSSTGSNNLALGYQAGQSITTGSSNIDIGNSGLATDANLIRIGNGQTAAYIAGVINGNGGGLTNLYGANVSGVALLSGGNTFNGNQYVASGNVGIGAAQPSQPLDVAGSGLFEFNNNFGTVFLGDTNHGIKSIYASGVSLFTYQVSSGIFLQQITGNVGIGTTNPANRLDVQGTADFTGSVGIGTTSPQNKLDVQGTADFTGRVGIGTQTPVNTLDVNGSADIYGKLGVGTIAPTHALLDVEGTSGGINFNFMDVFFNGANGTILLFGPENTEVDQPSVYASADIVTGGSFIALSDARIKHIIGHSDCARDLATLRGIEVTDYTYLDYLAKDHRLHKKVIAQQVEKVFPQAVTQSTNEIPDIYKRTTIQHGWIRLATDLKVGERVKLIGEKEEGIYPVLEVRDGEFRTDFKPKTDKVFVYGREVNDFRSVDYEAIAMLNVSATQELARKVDAQQTALTKLQTQLDQTVAEKEALQKRLAALEAKDQAREDRLARLESGLERISARGDYASLKQ